MPQGRLVVCAQRLPNIDHNAVTSAGKPMVARQFCRICGGKAASSARRRTLSRLPRRRLDLPQAKALKGAARFNAGAARPNRHRHRDGDLAARLRQRRSLKIWRIGLPLRRPEVEQELGIGRRHARRAVVLSAPRSPSDYEGVGVTIGSRQLHEYVSVLKTKPRLESLTKPPISVAEMSQDGQKRPRRLG